MTKELIEGTPKDGCGEGLCTACSAHDFTPSLGAVREAQRGLANEHISGDEIVAAFDRMIEKLVADALATRVPVQGEPNDDREAIAKALCEGAGTCWNDLTEQELVWHYRDAESVLAAGFSRGPVPDAATELRPLPANGCDKQAHDTMNRNINRVFKNNTGLMDALEAVKDERDAALAAVDRVKAVALPATMGNHDPHNDWNVGRHGLAKQVLEAALDGAPEPEWEYGLSVQAWRDEEPEPHPTREAAQHVIDNPELYRKWTHDNPVTMHRRRKAGPWLPVEGGSKP